MDFRGGLRVIIESSLPRFMKPPKLKVFQLRGLLRRKPRLHLGQGPGENKRQVRFRFRTFPRILPGNNFVELSPGNLVKQRLPRSPNFFLQRMDLDTLQPDKMLQRLALRRVEYAPQCRIKPVAPAAGWIVLGPRRCRKTRNGD